MTTTNTNCPVEDPPRQLSRNGGGVLHADNGNNPAQQAPVNPGLPLFTCDLSEACSFYPYANEPPVPVIAEFGINSLHQCRLQGKCDFEKALMEPSNILVRSHKNLGTSEAEDSWQDLVFRLGAQRFVCVNRSRIIGYAETAQAAEKMARDFLRDFGATPEPAGGNFQLIRCENDEICCENVTLEPETHLAENEFELRYPHRGLEWHQSFTKALHDRKSGFSILEGTPGTGKTTYLRHLMGDLKETHRFYYIPPTNMDILSKPNFIGFWASQRQAYKERKLVVVLEDADEAVMARGSDNREQVSSILNLSDGMLGDFLALQIICTINCQVSEIDQALLRPGRLITHRVFKCLTASEAARLAASLGIELPQAEEFSLAEIFSGTTAGDRPRPCIGFHA